MKHIIHFNRRATDARVWTVHNSKGCFRLMKLYIQVDAETEFKPEKKDSPRAFIVAHGTLLFILGGKAAVIR